MDGIKCAIYHGDDYLVEIHTYKILPDCGDWIRLNDDKFTGRKIHSRIFCDCSERGWDVILVIGSAVGSITDHPKRTKVDGDIASWAETKVDNGC